MKNLFMFLAKYNIVLNEDDQRTLFAQLAGARDSLDALDYSVNYLSTPHYLIIELYGCDLEPLTVDGKPSAIIIKITDTDTREKLDALSARGRLSLDVYRGNF